MVADLILDRHSLSRIVAIEIRPSVSSTMQLAQDWIKNSSLLPALFIADQQHQGRGRFQRTWISPPENNIYFTLVVPLKNMHSTFSLMIGLTLAESLQSMTQELGQERITVKWPNDVMVHDKKLAGILIELHALKNNSEQEWCAAIGIGINVQRSDAQAMQLTRPWIALSEIGLEQISRSFLLNQVINALLNAISLFETLGWSSFQMRWHQRDALFNQRVKVSQNFQPNVMLEGIAQGVDDTGRLILDANGQQYSLSTGEVWTFQTPIL